MLTSLSTIPKGYSQVLRTIEIKTLGCFPSSKLFKALSCQERRNGATQSIVALAKGLKRALDPTVYQ